MIPIWIGKKKGLIWSYKTMFHENWVWDSPLQWPMVNSCNCLTADWLRFSCKASQTITAGFNCLFQVFFFAISSMIYLSQLSLKVTYYATRCECDWLQFCLVWHNKWACPPRCVLDRSFYQPIQWTITNVAHQSVIQLGGHAHLWCQKRPIFKMACKANHTRTWW